VAVHQKPLSISLEKDHSHGRQVERQVSVFKSLDCLKSHWCGIPSLIKVERRGQRGNKNYYQIAYYMSSLSENAKTFAQKIKGHWQIENR
jgi:hypothetical protein